MSLSANFQWKSLTPSYSLLSKGSKGSSWAIVSVNSMALAVNLSYIVTTKSGSFDVPSNQTQLPYGRAVICT